MRRIRQNLLIASLLLLPLTSCDAPEEPVPNRVRAAAKRGVEIATQSAADATAQAALAAPPRENRPARRLSSPAPAVAVVKKTPPPRVAVDFPLPAPPITKRSSRVESPKRIAQAAQPATPPQPARVIRIARSVERPEPVRHPKPHEQSIPMVRAESIGPEGRSTPEGIEALRRVTEAYHGHLTYRAATHADITVKDGPTRRYARESLLAYGQAPGRALLHIHDTFGGSEAFYADGRSLCHYRSGTNDYTQVPTPTGIQDIAARIDGDMPLLFSPLSFVVAKERPAGIETVRVVGEELLGPRSVLILTGRLSAPLGSRIAASALGRELPAKERMYRIWIDRITSLVVRSEVRLSWSAANNPSLVIVEQTGEPELGISLPPDTFVFSRPPRSRERLTASR